MNIRDLKYIIAVDDSKSFAEAAKKEFVSQPALSMQIAKLEDEIGVKIFERDKKSIITTEIGKKIIEKARNIVFESKSIIDLAKSYQNPFVGDLIIGAFPTLAPYFFPKFLDKFSKLLPNIRFLLVEEKTEILIEKLKNGEIDLAFLAKPVEEGGFLISCDIFIEDFFLAVAKNHQLASIKYSINIEYLKNQELMLLDEGHCLREQALEVCSLHGINENKSFRATSLETLKQMVRSNYGVTLIPEIAVSKNDEINYIKIQKPPQRKIAMFCRKNFSKIELFNKIKDNF